MKLFKRNKYGVFFNEGGRFVTFHWMKWHAGSVNVRLWVQGLSLTMYKLPGYRPRFQFVREGIGGA